MQKPTIVMIHGLIGSLQYFEPQRLIPSAQFRHIDLLGYGQFAGVDSESLTLHAQVENVANAIKSKVDEPVWLLGHSMGGAVAMMLAGQEPELVKGVINVEGNFTMRDAFWSSAIARMPASQWASDFSAMKADTAAWLTRCGIEPTEARQRWATHILNHQPASTVQAMSQAIIRETTTDGYRATIQCVLDRGCSIHLIAGERSAEDWDVPRAVRLAAKSYNEVGSAGHLMMLEQPASFCDALEQICSQINTAQ